MVNVRKPSWDAVGAVIRLKNKPDSALICQVPWLFCQVRLWNRATSFNTEGFVDAHGVRASFIYMLTRCQAQTNSGHPLRFEKKSKTGPATYIPPCWGGIKWLHCLRSNECFTAELQVSHTVIIWHSNSGNALSQTWSVTLNYKCSAQFAGH